MRVLPVLLLIVASLAGCASDEPPTAGPTVTDGSTRDPVEGDATTTRAPTSSAAPSTTRPPTSGPSSTSAPTSGQGSDPDPLAPQEARTQDFTFDGKWPLMACVPAGLNTCIFAYRDGETLDDVQPETMGSADSFSFTVTWEANSPFTEEVAVWVDRVVSCGDGCWEYEDPLVVSGPSPLAVEGSATSLGSGPLSIWVRHVGVTPDPVYGYVHPEQPFHIEGTLTYPSA